MDGLKGSVLSGRLGYLVAVKHTGVFNIPQKFLSYNGQTASYQNEEVTTVYTVYIHINGGYIPNTNTALPPPVTPGQCVDKGITVLGYIMNPGGGSHLHFELRKGSSRGNWSRNLSLMGDSRYWAANNQGNTGYYTDLQKMADAGLRDPMDFITANGVTSLTLIMAI